MGGIARNSRLAQWSRREVKGELLYPHPKLSLGLPIGLYSKVGKMAMLDYSCVHLENWPLFGSRLL